MQKSQKSKNSTFPKWGIILVVTGLLLLVGIFVWVQKADKQPINSFDACVAAGNAIMTSYPEQCAADGKTFTNPRQ